MLRDERTTFLPQQENAASCSLLRHNISVVRTRTPIFMKFTWLVRVHSWVTPIVFGNNRPNRTTYMGKNVPDADP